MASEKVSLLIAKKCRIYFIILTVILTVDIVAASYYYNLTENYFLNAAQDTADVGVVFFAGFTGNHGLNADCIRSLKKTITLFRTGKIRNILCLGGARIKSGFFGAKLMKNYLVKNSIPAEKIIVDYYSYDTSTNIAIACKYIRHNQWEKVMLVSSNLHLYRINKLLDICKGGRFYYPHMPDKIEGISDLWDAWKAVHHEWLAYTAAAIIPRPAYDALLSWIRAL